MDDIYSLHTDIERKHLKEQQELKQTIERLTREKGELLTENTQLKHNITLLLVGGFTSSLFLFLY